eukprot:2689885-Prymnesium_polylepis.2
MDGHQLSVVTADDRASIVVRACPGAGKSTTVANRVKALVERGVPPGHILVLTYSRAARDDLAAKLERFGSGMPSVATHHSHALALLRSLPGPHVRSQVVTAS